MSGKALFRRYGWTLPTIDSLGLGRASFAFATYSANNDLGSATIGVDRLESSQGALTVRYSAQPGTAQAGVDFLQVTGSLSWASGDTARKFFTVPVLDTLEQSGIVTVLLSLLGSDSLLGAQRTATLEINRDLLQAAITPSDFDLLSPIPYAGLLAPNGGRVAVEGFDGSVVTLDLPPGPPGALFTGMTPRRVLETGTDVGIQLFGLSRPGIAEFSPDAGDRVLRVVPSDTDPLPLPAVGGFYLPNGGRVSFTTADTAEIVVLPPRTAFRPGTVLGISAAGTDADPIYAFVRGAFVGEVTFTFSAGGAELTFSDDGPLLRLIP